MFGIFIKDFSGLKSGRIFNVLTLFFFFKHFLTFKALGLFREDF